ncbi:phosphoribosylglycinamide formyltransferase [Candidatus Peregrinibacteria bacterium]|nr:MAG: phosphoribosylglycinamide formyltransferase [Candidatus Peregrinibacteria bacterium]
MTFRLGILASGNGTDLDAIYKEMDEGLLPDVEVAVVLSDKETAPVLEKARVRGIRAEWVNPRTEAGELRSREDYDRELAQRMGDVDLVCLVGYMRILTPVFIRVYSPTRILNVHPALLPKYGGNGWYGMKVHEAVIANGEKESGMTIHFVDFGVDSGPMILQKKLAVEPGETPETLKAKVQELEKRAYPEAIRLIYQERVGNLGE